MKRYGGLIVVGAGLGLVALPLAILTMIDNGSQAAYRLAHEVKILAFLGLGGLLALGCLLALGWAGARWIEAYRTAENLPSETRIIERHTIERDGRDPAMPQILTLPSTAGWENVYPELVRGRMEQLGQPQQWPALAGPEAAQANGHAAAIDWDFSANLDGDGWPE